jgi:cobalt-zinc-cadmium efflux system membrane fusion protein
VIRRGRLATVAVAILLAAAGVATYRLWPRPAPPAPAETAATLDTGTVKFLMEQQWLIRMKLAQAQPRRIARQITGTGRIVPAAGHHALAAPPVAGIVAGGPTLAIGQSVARGQLLALVRQQPTAAEAAQLDAAQAQLRASEAQLALERARLDADRRRLAEAVRETQARLDHAWQELDRAHRLYERKAYALRQVEAAEAEYRAADAAHAAAIAQRDALPAEPVSAPRPAGPAMNAEYAVIAPIAGTVVKIDRHAGAQVAPGQPIVELVNLDTVWLEVPIFERDLHRLAQPIRATFSTPAHPGREFQATLVDLGAVIDPQSRAATALFRVDNRAHALRIGMQANVRLDAGEAVDAVMIPREAVLESAGKRFVYVLRSGEDFERREVTLGDEHGDAVAVLAGLKPGERVVTQGAYQLYLHELRPAAPGAHTHET